MEVLLWCTTASDFRCLVNERISTNCYFIFNAEAFFTYKIRVESRSNGHKG